MGCVRYPSTLHGKAAGQKTCHQQLPRARTGLHAADRQRHVLGVHAISEHALLRDAGRRLAPHLVSVYMRAEMLP